MKQILFFLFSFAIFVSVNSCSSDSAPNTLADSFQANSVLDKKIIQTDSGKIEIEITKGTAEGKATLYDKDGKVLQKGSYVNDKPAGAWIKYDASGNVISAEHYSNGKPLMKLDQNDFKFRQWNNQKLGMKFNVPTAWKEIASPNPSLLVSFEKQTTDPSTAHMKPNFSIVRATLQAGENLTSLANMQIDLMHKNYERVDIIDENNIAVDSCLSFRRYGMYFSGDQKVGFLNVIIVSGTDVWFYSCEAPNNQQAEFLKYQGVFQSILESFTRVKE